jgi:hypothetical protein
MRTFATHGFVNQLLVYTVVMIGFSGSIGLGTVWMRHQISITANSTKQLAARIADVERHLEEATATAETERDANVLLRRNVEWNLGLVPPRPEQIIHVAKDPVLQLAAKRDRGLFGDAPAMVSIPNTFRR